MVISFVAIDACEFLGIINAFIENMLVTIGINIILATGLNLIIGFSDNFRSVTLVLALGRTNRNHDPNYRHTVVLPLDGWNRHRYDCRSNRGDSRYDFADCSNCHHGCCRNHSHSNQQFRSQTGPRGSLAFRH